MDNMFRKYEIVDYDCTLCNKKTRFIKNYSVIMYP